MHAHERGAWRRPDLAAGVATAAHPAVLNGDESVHCAPLQQLSRQVLFSYLYCSPVGCGCLGFVGFLVRRGRICCMLPPSDFAAGMLAVATLLVPGGQLRCQIHLHGYGTLIREAGKSNLIVEMFLLFFYGLSR